MSFKGTVRPDHVPQNKFKLSFPGLPPILFLDVDGLEHELETVDLPDRTKASGGQIKAFDFTATVMHHHDIERKALEQWHKQSQEPVAANYKKTGTLTRFSLTGVPRSYRLVGVFPKKDMPSNLAMKNEGDAVEDKWTFCCDEMKPL